MEEPSPATNPSMLQQHESVEYEINIQLEQNATTVQDEIFTEAESSTTLLDHAVTAETGMATLYENIDSENSHILEGSIGNLPSPVYNSANKEIEDSLEAEENRKSEENPGKSFEPKSSEVSFTDDLSSNDELFDTVPIESITETSLYCESPEFSFADEKEERNIIEEKTVELAGKVSPIFIADENEESTTEETKENQPNSTVVEESTSFKKSEIVVDPSTIQLPTSIVDDFSHEDGVSSESVISETHQQISTLDKLEESTGNKNIENPTKTVEKESGLPVELPTSVLNSAVDDFLVEEDDVAILSESAVDNKTHQISNILDEEATTEKGNKNKISDITVKPANRQNSILDDSVIPLLESVSKETQQIFSTTLDEQSEVAESLEKDKPLNYIRKEYLVLAATLGMAACMAYFVFKRRSAFH